MTDLAGLLGAGRTYLWALRLLQEAASPEDARATLAEAGIDLAALAALRELEPAIARFPAPTLARPDGRYLRVPIPPEGHVFFTTLVCEHGAEAGLEVTPADLTWTFAHDEAQFVTGGRLPVDALMPDGTLETRPTQPGDVLALPKGTRLTFHSSEDGGAWAHSHVFMTNLHDGENRVFYDAVQLLKLQQLGIAGSPEGLPPLEDVAARTELRDWAELVAPRPGGAADRPTWLRNGWAAREWTRALDHHEGTRRIVLASPDRDPADFLPWGADVASCRVNPLIAEQAIAITDCVFPAGYHRSQPATELWFVLRGQARIELTLAPLHGELVARDVTGTSLLVVPGGSRVTVRDATDDLVVRRVASSCAVNGHWKMMETKLEADGTWKEHL